MKVFLDSSVIIIGLEEEKSNSAIILNLLFNKKIEGVISERVIIEVKRYFKKIRGRGYGFIIESLLRKNCNVISEYEVKNQILVYRGEIKEKDLEQLAVVRRYSIKHLIAYDRDFNKIKEYVTPKKFLKDLNSKTFESEY